MSIQRYVNFENINTNIENEGKRIQEKDLFISLKIKEKMLILETVNTMY